MWHRYLAIALPGLGMFCEAYIVFSVGNISSLQEAIWPDCYETFDVCPQSVIDQKIDSYIQIAGIMFGMIVMGLVADHTGRKWGSRIVSVIMLIGVISLTFSPFAISGHTNFVLFIIAQTWYGVGVGGEYPLASSSAAEKTEEKKGMTKHRGREVVLVFANQGLGNLMNCIVIVIALAIFGQTGDLDANGSRKVMSLQYGVGAVVCVVMVCYRLIWLHESKYFKEKMQAEADHAARVLNEEPGAAQLNELQSFINGVGFYGPRQLVASLAWIANDFTFYGNKLQQSFFISQLHPTASYYRRMQFAALNSFIALLGYYAAAYVMDKHWYGRRACQIFGFVMLFFLNIIIYVDYDALTASSSTAQNWFQAIYYLSSFFNQFGPNCTTWLVAGEIFPTVIRTTNGGFAAMMGKLGAIISSIWIVNLSNPMDVFLVSAMWAVGGAAVSWLFLPDTTGLKLKDLDEFHEYLIDNRVSEYHGEAVNPSHLSVWENMLGWSASYDRKHVHDDIDTSSGRGEECDDDGDNDSCTDKPTVTTTLSTSRGDIELTDYQLKERGEEV